MGGAALACCLGLAASSLTTTGLLVAGLTPRHSRFVAMDALIWGAIAVIGWRMRRTRGRSSPDGPAQDAVESRGEARPGVPGPVWLVRVVFGATACLAVAAVTATHAAAPHGEWDAWAIWNLHARFLFRAGEAWRSLLAIEWAQPEYPLLLPASVARVWAYAGRETTIGPALIGAACGAAAVIIVIAAIGTDRRRAWIAGALVLGAGSFLLQIPSQCADVPLAAFMVAALAVTCGRDGPLQMREGLPAAALAAGALSASSAWMKNEGLVFLLLMLLCVTAAAVWRGRARQWWWWAAGAAPALLVVAWFKLTLAPTGSLLQEPLGSRVGYLIDLDRHLAVATLMAQHILRWGTSLAVPVVPLVGLAAVWAFIRGGVLTRVMVGVVGLMLGAYYLVYLTTPFDLAWHVSTSFDRLMAQLWPSLVLSGALGEKRR
jgi:hypothetical protein